MCPAGEAHTKLTPGAKRSSDPRVVKAEGETLAGPGGVGNWLFSQAKHVSGSLCPSLTIHV